MPLCLFSVCFQPAASPFNPSELTRVVMVKATVCVCVFCQVCVSLSGAYGYEFLPVSVSDASVVNASVQPDLAQHSRVRTLPVLTRFHEPSSDITTCTHFIFYNYKLQNHPSAQAVTSMIWDLTNGVKQSCRTLEYKTITEESQRARSH